MEQIVTNGLTNKKTKDIRQKTEDRRQEIESRRQREATEGSGRKTEDGRRKMEDGRWKTEDRGRNNRQCENSSTQENYEKKKQTAIENGKKKKSV